MVDRKITSIIYTRRMQTIRMKYHFPNPDNNEWINKYNNLVDEIASREEYYIEIKKTQPKRDDKIQSGWSATQIGIHHIIPKKIDMSLVKDKNNLLYIPFKEHCDLHYYLWKANPIYAAHLWFIAVAGRKMNIWDVPGGEEEYKQLSRDVQLSRRK